MSAPERFQVGDTVRCVDASRWSFLIMEGRTYEVASADMRWVRVVMDDGKVGGFRPHRFVLVSRPTPPALDPWVWDPLAVHEELVYVPGSYVDNVTAWSRFCYWATEWNLAAHFLPTEAAARTRASNGRDVPVATTNPERTLLAALLAIDAEHVKAHDVPGCVLCWPSDGSWPCVTRMETDDALEALRALTEGEGE